MGKKRKTRQEKIIARLRRELQKESVKPVTSTNTVKPLTSIKSVPVLRRISETRDPRRNARIKLEKNIFVYAPGLIKKDLKKTVLLSLVFIFLIIIIKLFFRL